MSATVNGRPARFGLYRPGQVNLQIPYETASGTAVVGINNAGQVSYSLFQVAPTRRGIFSLNGALNPDGTAKVGSQAFLYITGDGDVTQSLATGATPGCWNAAVFSACSHFRSDRYGWEGSTRRSFFYGITPGSVGVTQINFQLPSGLTGVQPVVVTVNGVASAPVNLTITN